MKKNLLLIICAAALIATKSYSQNSLRCGTTEIMNEYIKKHPEYLKKQEEQEKYIQEYIKTAEYRKTASTQKYIIPIVFHIIHQYGSENITDAKVLEQVNILNQDYNKLNPDISAIISEFQSITADAGIEFRLAQKDPDGNCTTGIDRIYSYKTNNGNDLSKLNQWDRSKYLNIWVVNSLAAIGTFQPAGYASFPLSTTNEDFIYDGIIILSDYLGNSSVGAGRALTHEVGHYLNLMHPWGSGTLGVDCGNDLVNDTPETKGWDNCPTNLHIGTCDTHTLSATYNFNGVTVSSGIIDPTPAPIITHSNVIFSNFTATGLSANSASNGIFDFSNWDTGATNGANGVSSYTMAGLFTGTINTVKYYEFTITPAATKFMNLTGMSFTIQRNLTGIRTFAVRSSVNNYVSNIAATTTNTTTSVQSGNVFFIHNDTNLISTGCNITLSGTSNAPITFRIYGWNAEDIDGTFGVDNVILSGTYGTTENIQNFMEYSYCSKMYTEGQKARMHATLNSNIAYRNNLWTDDNLIATGTYSVVAQACLPIVDFSANRYFICQGATVNFKDAPLNPNISGRLWTFEGGTPATSTATSPTITYNTPYWQTVALTYTNSAGAATTTKGNYVFVSPPWVDYVGTFSDNFEDETKFNNQWIVVNKDNNISKWKVATSGFYDGVRALMLNAYNPPIYTSNTYPPILIDPGVSDGDIDEVVTPSFDLSNTTSSSLNFKYSYATSSGFSGNVTEGLKVYYSLNCGQSWTLLNNYSKQGAALVTAGVFFSSFVPTTSSQWKQESISIPSTGAWSNVRFKFEYTSGLYSNNLYIDDFNISGTLGVNEIQIDNIDVSVYPNPATESATLLYRLTEQQNIKIEVYDIVGKKVMEVADENQNEGDHAVEISKQNLTNGIYNIKLIGDKGVLATRKFVISE